MILAILISGWIKPISKDKNCVSKHEVKFVNYPEHTWNLVSGVISTALEHAPCFERKIIL